MKKLAIAAAVLAMMLGGCGKSVTRNFRVIAMAEVDGQKVEGSTVMQVTYTAVNSKYSLTGAGGAVDLKGEALIFDLKGKGAVFVLPAYNATDGVIAKDSGGSVLGILGFEGGIGTLDDHKLEVVRSAQGRRKLSRRGDGNLPIFVAFKDEAAPRTIYEVDPNNIEAWFPGVRFVGIDIEFTDAPVTTALLARLPWLKRGWDKIQFERDPPGSKRRYKDKPLPFKITEGDFFALGSIGSLR